MAWFIAPYRRRDIGTFRARYCAMNDFSAQISADGGRWAETEVLGDCAIVKVRASVATLQAIAQTAGFQRLPKDLLDDSLASLTPSQRATIRDRLVAMGYTLAEVRAALGDDLSTVTLRDVLRFAATRRRKPRYDEVGDQIVLDGPVQSCRPLASVDAEVTD